MEYNEIPSWAGEKCTPPANFKIGDVKISQGFDSHFKVSYLRIRMLTELAAFRMMLPDYAVNCDILEEALSKLNDEEFMKRHYETERQL
jgi:hypothetical protein